MRVTIALGAIATVVLGVAGCSADAPTSPSTPPPVSPAASASPPPTHTGVAELALPVEPGADVHGLVSVGDHRLAVHCAGDGSPTVVILHGGIDKPGVTSHDYYGALRSELEEDYRVCSYDRTNVGDSDSVEGTQSPEMVVADLDALMEAIGDQGPYLLIGQSAGGMVASAYAVAHPEKVAGIVLADASFDEEVTISDVGMVPEGMSPCDPVNREYDGEQHLQKIDNCAMYKWAFERRDQRPKVPLVFLASEREPASGYSDFGAAYTEAIVPLQKAYAESWSPGKFVWVDAGHDIHVDDPTAVADAVDWVVDNATQP